MISFDNITKVYGGRTLFKNASFSLFKGERCGLVGRNGSGKSTLLKLILGLEEPDDGTVSKPKHYRLGYLEQHIAFTKNTIIDEAALGLPPDDRDSLYKAEAILFGLGFGDIDLESSPHILSGGYHLRLHLAKVLLSDPDCLFLDEPTNYLDITSIRWLQRYLRSWKNEFLIISHDRDFMDSITTHTVAIHRENFKKIKGGTEELFEQIVLEETIHEKTREKLEQKKTKAETFASRFGAKATKARQAQSKLKAVAKMPSLQKLAQIDDLDFNFNYQEFPGKQMLKAEGVSFSYCPEKNEPPLIHDFELEIHKNDCIAVIGKNGRGKSTLLKLLAGELEADNGNIVRSPNLRVGYFGQTNIDRLHPKHTIESEINLANPRLTISDVRRICGIMMFSGDEAKKSISVLSGGERSRVLLGKILGTPCNLLFLDEPTHHLDMESIESLIDAIETFDGAVVIITHSEMILERLPLTKIVVCTHKEQELIVGDYDDFISRGGWHDEEEANGTKDKKKSKQDSKKQSVALAQAHAKILNPLQKKMAAVENQIEQLEKQLDKDNDLLIEASEAEQADLIKKYSKKIAEHQKQIEDLFYELEKQSEEYHNKKKIFDEELESLN